MPLATFHQPTEANGLTLGEVVTVLSASLAAAVLFSIVVVAAYVVKSKLGINLMDGPSPLHGLYVLIR